MKNIFCCEGEVNMTYLALNLSHYVNGVAKRHGEVSQHMFARYKIDSITNGVHAARWTSPPFQQLFDRYIPGWRSASAAEPRPTNVQTCCCTIWSVSGKSLTKLAPFKSFTAARHIRMIKAAKTSSNASLPRVTRSVKTFESPT